MKPMKRTWLALLLLSLLFGLGACTLEQNEAPLSTVAQPRDTVMVYCWGEHMVYNGYAAYVQSQIPEADVVFVVGQNSMAYYEFLNEHGALPDILTVRRMSMIDAERLRDSLLDLSETEAAAGFHNIYLENYRFPDGSINWLPACGEIDGYIANLDLFAQYGIALPTDRASFDAMCDAFLAVGILPYTNDYKMDYTCLETLQGLSIQELMTAEGNLWRTDYESGAARQLDEALWLPAFARLERQLARWHVPAEAANHDFYHMAEVFRAGEAAMMRGTGNDVIAFTHAGMNVSMLPYFGDTPEDSWLLTYPSFNVALSKQITQDPQHEALCMRVLDVMFSQEAQQILAGNHNCIPYNTGVSLSLDESMQCVEPLIERNHLYLRLASGEFFDASKQAVSKMVAGEYDARQAFDAFNAVLRAEQTEPMETVLHIDQTYSNRFEPDRGNEGASAMTNTLRSYFGSDIAIAHGTSYSGIVFNADYTEQQVGYMVTDDTIRQYTRAITGAQLRNMLENLLANEYSSGYGSMCILNRYFLPVLSGCEMVVRNTPEGYRLADVTVNGQPLPDDQVFTVTIIASLHIAEPMLDALWADEGGVDAWAQTRDTPVKKHWMRCMLGSEDNAPYPLAAPTDYIDLVL